jgi:hypothetical protein
MTLKRQRVLNLVPTLDLMPHYKDVRKEGKNNIKIDT